jgi:selenocysteine-specific elongation factor
MPIDRAFTVAGHGTVVTGTVVSGRAAVGDELEWHPEGRVVRVRGLQRHDRPVEEVGRGTRAAINLAGVHHTEIRRGQELGTVGYLRPTRVLSVVARTLSDATRPLRHRGRYRLHLGTADVAATLSLLDPLSGLEAGSSALAQLVLAEPVVAVHGEPFVLREESPPTTLGGGHVLQPTARRLRRREVPAVERLTRLDSADPEVRASAALAFQGLAPWSEPDLTRVAGIPRAEVPSVVDRLAQAGCLIELPVGPRRSIRILAEAVADLEDRVLRALGRLHAARPRQAAVRKPHVLAELPDIANDALIAGLLDRLKDRGAILSDERTVALKSHEPKLSQGERKLKNEIAAAFASGGFSPPDASELAARAGPRAGVVPELLALLVDEGRLVELGGGLYLDFDIEAEMRKRVVERLSNGSSLTMAELRDLLGTTRKYAVPIGEYLDRIGLTQREGDTRRLRPAP